MEYIFIKKVFEKFNKFVLLQISFMFCLTSVLSVNIKHIIYCAMSKQCISVLFPFSSSFQVYLNFLNLIFSSDAFRLKTEQYDLQNIVSCSVTPLKFPRCFDFPSIYVLMFGRKSGFLMIHFILLFPSLIVKIYLSSDKTFQI